MEVEMPEQAQAQESRKRPREDEPVIFQKVEKSEKIYSGDPLRSKIPNVVQRDMQIRVALPSSFGPKLIWADTGAPRRPNSEILPRHTVPERTAVNFRYSSVAKFSYRL